MRTEPRYSKSLAKPARGPKEPKKMRSGKRAQRRGKDNQRQIAEYMEGRNRYPLKGVDIVKGKFAIEARCLDRDYPRMVENMLVEAELHAKRLNPDLIPILSLRELGKRIPGGLFIARNNHGKEMMEAINGLEEKE